MRQKPVCSCSRGPFGGGSNVKSRNIIKAVPSGRKRTVPLSERWGGGRGEGLGRSQRQGQADVLGLSGVWHDHDEAASHRRGRRSRLRSK